MSRVDFFFFHSPQKPGVSFQSKHVSFSSTGIFSSTKSLIFSHSFGLFLPSWTLSQRYWTSDSFLQVIRTFSRCFISWSFCSKSWQDCSGTAHNTLIFSSPMWREMWSATSCTDFFFNKHFFSSKVSHWYFSRTFHSRFVSVNINYISPSLFILFSLSQGANFSVCWVLFLSYTMFVFLKSSAILGNMPSFY